MGCTGSKQARLDRRVQLPYLRSYSVPVKQRGGGVNSHVVALKSTTLGSLSLDRSSDGPDEEMMKCYNDVDRDFSKEAGGVSPWSDMIERRIPRTPNKTPTHEPEVINAWELMEGLEDISPLRPSPIIRSFSFDTSGFVAESKSRCGFSSPALGLPMVESNDSIVPDFDPEILSAFRKALEELSPPHPVILRSPDYKERILEHKDRNVREIPQFSGIVRARVNAFQEKINAKRANSNANSVKVVPFIKSPPNSERKVVFYFTSLRGVRKTYEDCSNVKFILQGYGVRIDERDVSLHGGFKEELNEVLNATFGGKLPRVFADGRYLGGAEEVRQMHEAGELGKALEGCEMAAMGKGGIFEPCNGCGGVRFVPCEVCSGSCKVYVEEEDEGEEHFGGFRRCPECNENGLVRCPLCC
ncbi:uncharacterized protein At3g28850-like [Typha latifolia]|uniref:uncharacterized protein At3g28850-like n=1 Tax=Typha latifolia TaxID=4733 RepID=UPI003C2F3240